MGPRIGCRIAKDRLVRRGIIPKVEGWAELWKQPAATAGRNRWLRRGGPRHRTAAVPLADGKYLVFTRSKGDLGAPHGARN